MGFFYPFQLKMEFEFCGIVVEDEIIMGEAVRSEERESQSQATCASYFLSPPSPKTTRSKSKKRNASRKNKASTEQSTSMRIKTTSSRQKSAKLAVVTVTVDETTGGAAIDDQRSTNAVISRLSCENFLDIQQHVHFTYDDFNQLKIEPCCDSHKTPTTVHFKWIKFVRIHRV